MRKKLELSHEAAKITKNGAENLSKNALKTIRRKPVDESAPAAGRQEV